LVLMETSQLPPFVIHSTSKGPNMNFLISRCLTYIFTFGKKKLPKYARDKYFRRIRNLWPQQYKAANHRAEGLLFRNTRTSTYFRFSFRKIVYYFGLYYPCHCGLPAPFVMSQKRYACHLHHKTLEFYRNIRNVDERCSRTTWLSKGLDTKHTKSITSYRTGITFKKEFSWYNGKFYKCHYDLQRFRSTTPQQNVRYKRHEKHYKGREGYIGTFPHKITPPPPPPPASRSRGPTWKKKKKKKSVTITPPDPVDQWKRAAKAAVTEWDYHEEITCPECNLLRCIRLGKYEFFWPDYKRYDRHHYPTCVCGFTYKK